MGTLIIIAQLFLSLTILVTLHEWGHYAAARMFGTRVEKFYLFFDFLFPFPDKMNFSLFKKKVGDTEYGIGWFPMGGYVKIAGMMDESRDESVMGREPAPDEYLAKAKWQRLIIMLGGVIVNFILGFLLYGMVLFVWGEKYLPNDQVTQGIYIDDLGEQLGLQNGDKILEVGKNTFERFNPGLIREYLALDGGKTIKVVRDGKEQVIQVPEAAIKELLKSKNKDKSIAIPNSPFVISKLDKSGPGEGAGLEKGDSLIGINGNDIRFFGQFRTIAQENKGKKVQIDYVRKGVRDSVNLTLSENGTIGANNESMDYFFDMQTQEFGAGEAFTGGIDRGCSFIGKQFRAFGMMFSGDLKVQDSLGGFGSIGGLFSPTWDWHSFWKITAILSLILAIMNLLPIPLLDGGYVVFLLFEMITGREIPEKVMNVLLNIGLYFILGLMIFANGMDILRAIGVV